MQFLTTLCQILSPRQFRHAPFPVGEHHMGWQAPSVTQRYYYGVGLGRTEGTDRAPATIIRATAEIFNGRYDVAGHSESA